MKPRVGRNDPCPCGSGNKYKRCCMEVRLSASTGAHAGSPTPSDSHLERPGGAAREPDEPEVAVARHGDAAIAGESRSRTALAEAESSLLVHLELYSWLGNVAAMAAAYGNLGRLYQELGDVDAADVMRQEASRLFASR